MPDRKTYSVKDTAEIIGVTESMIYKMLHKGELPYIKLGSRYVIPIERFNEWFKQRIKGGLSLCEEL